MGKLSRTKGKRGELECVDFWKTLFPKAHRHLEFQQDEAAKGIDVVLNENHVVQVKLGSAVPKKCYEFLRQINVDRENVLGWVQARRDAEEPIVMLWAKDFHEMIAYFYTLEKTLNEMREKYDNSATKSVRIW